MPPNTKRTGRFERQRAVVVDGMLRGCVRLW